MQSIRSCLITGASSGIGEALALTLSRPDVTLHLSGRDAGRLTAVAEACRTKGAIVHSAVLDVRDAEQMEAWISNAGRLDLVVANAGISAGTGTLSNEPESPAQARAIFATNLNGVLNTVLPALAAIQMQTPGPDRVRGRIAVIASIAAFIAAPGAPAYCASKAAIDTWTVATAIHARQLGIAMTSVCPGYIRTAMTAGNKFPMPGLMGADRAARIILRGIAAGRMRIAFPWWMALAARLSGLLPPGLRGRALATQPGKPPARAVLD